MSNAESRNLYRMQLALGDLAKALRRIAEGCEGKTDPEGVAATIAKQALSKKMRDQ